MSKLIKILKTTRMLLWRNPFFNLWIFLPSLFVATSLIWLIFHDEFGTAWVLICAILSALFVTIGAGPYDPENY